jgi:hypothetical protein
MTRPARLSSFAVMVAVLALAGCGGSSSSKTADQANGNRPNSDQFAAFQKCLKQQGVTLPGGGRPGGGFRPQGGQGQSTTPQQRPQISDAQRQKMQKAMSACRSKLPQGAGPGGGQGPGGGFGPPGGGPPGRGTNELTSSRILPRR